MSNNKISKESFNWSLKKLAIILQPFVPHISEEIWSNLGNKTLCINESWKIEDVKRKVRLKLAVQINGKTKHILDIEDNSPKKIILDLAKSNDKIKKNLLGKKIIREIYVPGKIVNLVVK